MVDAGYEVSLSVNGSQRSVNGMRMAAFYLCYIHKSDSIKLCESDIQELLCVCRLP